MIAMSDSTMITGANVWAASGKSGTANRMNPYAPSLSMIAGQDHRARRRRLGVGVGQPGVEREHRDLDGERQEERDEREQLEPVGEAAVAA